MRIKRFEAKDTQSALAMVKKELGEDAVILATRSLPPGDNGGRSRIEVVAAMDYDLDEIEAAAEASSAAPAPPSYGYQSVRRKPAEPVPPAPVAKKSETPPHATLTPHLESHDLRLRFANLMRQGAPAKPAPVRYRPEEIAPFQPKAPATPPKPIAPAEVRQWRDEIIDKIQVTSSQQSEGPTLIALVGATGVGKTTTAAKLAAWYTLRQGLRVTLLSMDCYRIGATDQLRTYARIMRLPCEIVLRRQDLSRALERHQDKDIVIIDTAGKSPYDESHIQELQEWFAPCPGIEPHLVVSATTKKEDLQTIITSYASLSASGLILTKLDETRAYATLCQQVVASKLPVSYLSTGQRVPEDFMVASKEFLDTLFKQGWAAAAPLMTTKFA